MQIRSMDSITMSTHTRVHDTRFKIETSFPSNQIYARLVFRIWTVGRYNENNTSAASDLSLVERDTMFFLFLFSRRKEKIPLDFFLLIPLIPLFTILIRAHHRSLLATFSLARACVNFH